MKAPTILLLSVVLLEACVPSEGSSGGRTGVVASVYPLAWISERIGGTQVHVGDLTPPGVEAHEVSLNAEQRAEISDAGVLVHVGDLGFQPDVEASMDAASSKVVTAEAAGFLAGSDEFRYDPHVWLDPIRLAGIAADVSTALQETDPDHAAYYAGRDAELLGELTALDEEFRSGLADCDHETFVTTHEAFAYLAAAYGLEQVGVQGLVPESEPDAASIERTVALIDSGEAAPVVFYEPTDEGRRIAEAIAADAGVGTAELNPIEAAPETGDYVTAMRSNLRALREGLGCR